MMLSRASKWIPWGVALLALAIYVATSAPGLTWANQGADGGDLLAAAVSNGVPHPPGYPLYTLLLQGWLAVIGLIYPASELAWRGNLFSACCAALSVGVTIQAITDLLRQVGKATWASWVAGLAWAISPLLWSQATITEVYALHVLFFSLLGWWAISGKSLRWLIVLTMVGTAHHLTLVFLLPAVLYLQWSQHPGSRWSVAIQLIAVVVAGGCLGLVWHLRTWWAAGTVAPVNWGFADRWNDLWWLISGQAYRSYFLSASASITFDRIAAWAYTITTQYTPVGLGLGLVGLAYLDQERPTLRNFSLLWLAPISIYSILYYTRDSEIYLLPVGWLVAVWLALGITLVAEGLAKWLHRPLHLISQGALLVFTVAILALLPWRWSTLSLRQDRAARDFLAQSASSLEPGSIVISRSDERTFALWYGEWASGELPKDLILVNDALYQFGWYRRLLKARYPTVKGIDQTAEELLRQNRAERPIFLADEIGIVPEDQLIAVGPLWKVK
ncbi:MAG: DUF2723 domain-containing protein [Caldilineaceae bacterium]